MCWMISGGNGPDDPIVESGDDVMELKWDEKRNCNLEGGSWRC